MAKFVKLIFHCVALINYVYAMYYDQMYVDLSKITPKSNVSDMKFLKGRLKFLTIWNMVRNH